MFPQLKQVNNESGIVLYIVLMTAIVIMIVSVGILTQSVNETNYGQQQIDQIACDQLAKGIFWNQFSSSFGAGNIVAMQTVTFNNAINGRNYTVTLTPVGGGYTSSCNYDTFQ